MSASMTIKRFAPGDPLPPAPPGIVVDPWSQHAESHLRVSDSQGVVAAACSLWYTMTPPLKGKQVGFIGHYWASGRAASRGLLEAACAELRSAGCTEAVGPLDGTTWRRYRFVTETSAEPEFFMEPANPPEWPSWWEDARFAALAGYHSALNEDLRVDDDRLNRAAARARVANLELRPIDLERFEDELRSIHRLSCDAFADNFLYSPISWPEFAEMYRPLRVMINPAFVLLADDPDGSDMPAGFIMAIPDILEQRRSGQSLTLILKSMAVHPRRRSSGLGGWLIAQAQANAAAAGMSRSVFALMHDENHSARIGSKYGRVIRRYTLFSRSLGA